MSERLGAQLQSGGLGQSIHTGLLGGGLFAGASLDLNFAATKNIGPLVTFTRASTGTYVGSNGVLQTAATDVPRFDHNPTTGESLGLLVEEQRTNLLLQSQELDATAVWGATNVTVSANTITAPDGTQTADTITDINGVAANPFMLQTVTLVESTTYSMSCFLKAGTATTARVGIRAKDGTIYTANVDLAAGTIANVNATSASIQPHQNGWYRCVVSAPSNTGATSARGLIYINTVSYTGTGTGSIHVWGAQLEAGAFPTSYIPTTTAAATRSADVASITGTNFSSWYRQDEGTVFASSTVMSTSYANGVLWDVGAGGAFGTTAYGAWSGTQWTLNPNTAPVNMFCTVTASAQSASAYALKTNDSSIAAAGLIGTQDTSCAMPASATTLSIGKAGWTAGNYFNGTIRRLTYWPQRLANFTLQAITQ